MDSAKYPLSPNSTKIHKPKTGWKQKYQKDLYSKFQKWWVEGLAKKTGISTKNILKLTNSSQVNDQNTTCLICDQKFENVQQCILHIKTVHFLKNPKQNFHYQLSSHSTCSEACCNSDSDEDSPTPQKMKLELQKPDMPDVSTSLTPNKANFKQIKPNTQNSTNYGDHIHSILKSRDPLGLETRETGQIPTKYVKLVNELIKKDDPKPPRKFKARTSIKPAANQDVIQLQRRLVYGTSQLFDVPKDINHQRENYKKKLESSKQK